MFDLEGFAEAIAGSPLRAVSTPTPWFVRLQPDELDRFRACCSEHRVALIDELDRQLDDLAMVRFPAAESGSERRDFIEREIAVHGGHASYGNWVYLPWDAKIVHLLDRDAYFEVITDRNSNKITAEERSVLATKRVGVMGLSVGGEAAVTIAQEHLCGEMVLADFDRLDLSNLNRLGAGFDELGQNKAVIVARRIAKINPYLPVRLFEDGVTDSNVEEFLDGLDLLVEECDGLHMKFDVRLRAKQRGLNVVFAADERGFLSVEPYADWPDLHPFHGRIEAPQPSKEAFPSPLAFMKALTEWMGGWDSISERSRRSLEQLGDTLCGYPQLASEARFAAGQIGHVVRRLLLGERVAPFFGHLDLDDLVPSEHISSG